MQLCQLLTNDIGTKFCIKRIVYSRKVENNNNLLKRTKKQDHSLVWFTDYKKVSNFP